MFAYPNNMVMDAYRVAVEAHYGQRRKYTGEPYIVHPVQVARTVSAYTDNPVVISAALLHDVIEDCPGYSYHTLVGYFGTPVARLVEEVTNVATDTTNSSRAARVEQNIQHLAAGSADAHLIKLADSIDNCPSMAACNPKFAAEVYIPEKIRTLAVLTRGPVELRGKLEMLLTSILLRL